MVNEGNFREDLFFRLAVLPLRVPPLRERMEDLPRLVAHFAPSMSPEAQAELCRALGGRRLAGNVRELRNIVQRAELLGGSRAIEGADEPGPTRPGEPAAREGSISFEGSFHEFQADAERAYLQRLMTRHGGQVADAAQRAGINRTYFYRLLRKHGL
jgi:DNA-binding NtrC family response regulator